MFFCEQLLRDAATCIVCQVEFPAVSGVFYLVFVPLSVNGIVCIRGVVSQCGINEAHASVLFYSIVLQLYRDRQVQHPRRGFFILEDIFYQKCPLAL